MEQDFYKQFNPNKDKYIKIKITDEMLFTADVFAKKMINEKTKEKQYKEDGGKMYTRFVTGILGEFLVFLSLGYSWKDVNLEVGDTFLYTHADLAVLGMCNIGVKTCEIGKFPLIYKGKNEFEIIVIIDKENKVGYILGIACPQVLDLYNSDTYVLSDKAKEKGKVGFYGFNHCYIYDNQDDLKLFLDVC